MKKSVRVAAVLLLLLAVLAGCTKGAEDPFSVFCGGFCADVVGELNGVAFSAVVKADAVTAAGLLPLTVTFYAPSGLSGTVLRREADGRVSLLAGDVLLRDLENADFLALFSLFPVSGEVIEVGLESSGQTRVVFQGGSLLLLPDGTPHALEGGGGQVRVLSFTAGE